MQHLCDHVDHSPTAAHEYIRLTSHYESEHSDDMSHDTGHDAGLRDQYKRTSLTFNISDGTQQGPNRSGEYSLASFAQWVELPALEIPAEAAAAVAAAGMGCSDNIAAAAAAAASNGLSLVAHKSIEGLGDCQQFAEVNPVKGRAASTATVAVQECACWCMCQKCCWGLYFFWFVAFAAASAAESSSESGLSS
jgi:hypothetical protein